MRRSPTAARRQGFIEPAGFEAGCASGEHRIPRAGLHCLYGTFDRNETAQESIRNAIFGLTFRVW